MKFNSKVFNWILSRVLLFKLPWDVQFSIRSWYVISRNLEQHLISRFVYARGKPFSKSYNDIRRLFWFSLCNRNKRFASACHNRLKVNSFSSIECFITRVAFWIASLSFVVCSSSILDSLPNLLIVSPEYIFVVERCSWCVSRSCSWNENQSRPTRSIFLHFNQSLNHVCFCTISPLSRFRTPTTSNRKN